MGCPQRASHARSSVGDPRYILIWWTRSRSTFDGRNLVRRVVSSNSIPATKSFLISATGCALKIEATVGPAFDLCDRYIFPSLPRKIADSVPADIHLLLLQTDSSSQLFVDDVLIASADQPQSLLRKALDVLDTTLIQRLQNLHAVHAGAVLIDGRALLVAGGSHSGKSSLVAELLRRGAACFSDEYALIDAAGWVHAYPRILLLRNGGNDQTPVLPESCNARVAAAPAQVGWVFSLQYDASAGWDVAPVHQSLALLSLLQNTPHVLADAPEMVNSFQRAIEGAACYAGHRGEAADAVSHMLQLMTR